MAETAKPEIPRAIAAGIAHHRAGRLAEAAEAYHKVLASDPDNFDALCLLGAIAHIAGRHHETIDYIGRAIAHAERANPARPPNPYAYSNLGEAYRATGQTGAAMACYEKALAIWPEYAEAHYHLGLVLSDEGRHQEAIACYRRATALKPELVLAQYNLGLALKAEGNTTEATACLREVLRLDPGNELAAFSLSSLTAQNPERPPERYVANLFDNHAPRFDTHLVEILRYGIPQALVNVARKHADPPQSGWDVLDLGCGTGLVGVAIAPFARRLVGVDLSLKMLERARERKLYDRLEHRDLLSLMQLDPASSYDIIAAADVFIYVGKLDDVVREAARLLRVGGALVFSVEAIEATSEATDTAPSHDYRLLASGRYAHSAEYLRKLARDNGFGKIDLSAADIRLERGAPVRGWLTLLAA